MRTKIIFFHLFLICSIVVYSQDSIVLKRIAEADLKKIDSIFKKTGVKLEERKKILKEKQENFNTEGLVELTNEVKTLNNNLVKYCDLSLIHI